ncbi:uncharacterized protein LOC132018742 [Mustela nigripes]|uniref:uncharacterized protein LOC132018742 n=1 Tax=Mustela nigripes TaxID=77151 RepID=UPI002815095E|nr:uncharacterized protein LOC132018742 [Mustela nigripes]
MSHGPPLGLCLSHTPDSLTGCPILATPVKTDPSSLCVPSVQTSPAYFVLIETCSECGQLRPPLLLRAALLWSWRRSWSDRSGSGREAGPEARRAGGRPSCLLTRPLLQTRKWEESRNEGDTSSPATLFPSLKPTVASGPDTANRLGRQLQNCVRRGVTQATPAAEHAPGQCSSRCDRRSARNCRSGWRWRKSVFAVYRTLQTTLNDIKSSEKQAIFPKPLWSGNPRETPVRCLLTEAVRETQSRQTDAHSPLLARSTPQRETSPSQETSGCCGYSLLPRGSSTGAGSLAFSRSAGPGPGQTGKFSS